MEHNTIKKSTRRYRRFPVNLDARITFGNRHYEGIVGNISEEGLAYTMTTFMQADSNFVPKGEITVAFTVPGDEALSLRCEIRWFLKPKDSGTSLIIGMKIIEHSSKYKDWIRRLESGVDQQASDGCRT